MSKHQIGSVHGVTAKAGSAAEVQSIVGGATSGTFVLDFAGQRTSALTFDDIAADIQAALRALSNISATGVVCAGGPLPAAVTVSFENEFLGVDVPKLKVYSIDLAGGTVTVRDTTERTRFFDADMLSIPAMRARLTAINGTLYTSAYLDRLSFNDMMYALRVHDSLTTI